MTPHSSSLVRRSIVPLIEPLPKPLEKALGVTNGHSDDIVIAVAADLTLRGAFGEEWLVVTKDRLLVYEPGDDRPSLRVDLPLAGIKSPTADSLVVGAALQVTVDGEPIELVRYTNARQRTFSRVAKYLADVAAAHEARAKGEEVKEEPRLTGDPDEQQRCPQCRLLLPEGTKVCPACLNKGKVMRRLLVYLRPYWKQTLTVWALMIASSLLNLIPPYLNRPLMDQVLVPQHALLTVPQRFTWLGWLVVGLLVTQALGQSVGIVRGRLVTFLSARLAHDLRTQLYQHLQLLSLRFFDKRQTGAVMTRVNQDTQKLQGTLMDGAQFFVVQKPDGYDTPVGERGQSLSGGERQRISIARAVLHNPRILILDEATSAVDTDTEKQIQDAIARLVKGRTTFAIAHRLSTLRNADRLVVLKDGKIEEVGTHAELLEKKGEFYRLVEMQQEMSKIRALAR
jgi:hypothetical protein